MSKDKKPDPFDLGPADPFDLEPTAMEYWKLCDELTIVQAALLILDVDPSITQHDELREIKRQLEGFLAVENALETALRRGTIKGQREPTYGVSQDASEVYENSGSIDPNRSLVEVTSLRKWLKSKGFRSEFFFAGAEITPNYLYSDDPRYAPKLAAAINAWQATEDQDAVSGKTPKQALIKWLNEHAAEYGLTDDDGKPSDSVIEDIAKIANWAPSGGAPKTPGT